MNRLYCRVILLGLTVMLVGVDGKDEEEIDWKAKIGKERDLFINELKTRKFHKMDHKLYTQDFVLITPDSDILGDFEALEKWDKEHWKVDHYTQGPAHIVSTCGNTAIMWRTHSYRDGEGLTRNGTFVELFVYKDGTAKTKLVHTTA